MGPSSLLSIYPARERAVLPGRKHWSVLQQHIPCAVTCMEMPSGRVLPRLSKVLGLEGDKKSIIKFEFNPKDGIDNPALSLTEDTDDEGVGEPRFYLLNKGSAETFGFCLHEELGCQGHIIRQVELGGLAQRRGLQDGDRLLHVNGRFVDHMDHHRVVQKIKASGNQVLLVVLDGDSYKAAKALGRDLSQMLPADIRPRLCHITRDKSGFGFSVSGPEGAKGTFQLSVRQDGPAERAGVPPGSWLLELNGASVRSYSYAQLARKLKRSGSKVTLLVASSAVEEFYRLRGLRVMAALADVSWLPFKVRELHMVKGPAGYGFLLKEDDCSSGATGQFLWDVDVGLPAEQAGMKEGDRLLAVNGESIEGLDHHQTVLRIRAHDDQVKLLVIDPASDEFYQSIGLSPLLFFEDTDPASGSQTPSLPSPSGSPGLRHVEVGPKGPGSWLVAAANSIGFTQVTPLARLLWLCCSQPSAALSPGTLLPCLS
ncbi:Na(+)/H(+) exchange regulatory cofactor NHE-RF4 isoform X1 [Grus americana]|uniref:Na(+)/H(+) exchange regulatory cofactor NHE-RF4 isoform X1 n=1 Tax=Grus americana TaxID=9117 RepID=UPI0024080F6B|nr:Na(+)/H(+) exchange regulatory cofactor NHE-RF4 isoform X1 [Grus americana]